MATYFREYLRDVFLKNWCEEHPKPDGTKYNIYRDGLKIYTTIDSRLQRYAEEAVIEHIRDLQREFVKECQHKKCTLCMERYKRRNRIHNGSGNETFRTLQNS